MGSDWQPNSELCTDERLSCIGTRVKVWTRWNSRKLTRTFAILSLNTRTSRTPSMKRMNPKLKMMTTCKLRAKETVVWNYLYFYGRTTNHLCTILGTQNALSYCCGYPKENFSGHCPIRTLNKIGT